MICLVIGWNSHVFTLSPRDGAFHHVLAACWAPCEARSGFSLRWHFEPGRSPGAAALYHLQYHSVVITYGFNWLKAPPQGGHPWGGDLVLLKMNESGVCFFKVRGRFNIKLNLYTSRND